MASVNDKLTDTRNAARPNSARVSAPRSAGGNSLACDSLSGWPTASKVHFVTYQIDSNSDPIAGTQIDCYGIVSGNTIGSLSVLDGTDAGNSIGDVVEMLPTASWGQDLSDWGMNEHNRDGSHSDVTADSVNTDTLVINTGTTLPAGDIASADIADSAVTTAKIADANVTSAKLAEAFFRGRRQDDTSNTSPTGYTCQFGWGWMLGSGTAAMEETVTFPTAFSAAPIVIIGALNQRAGSDPTVIGDLVSISGHYCQGGDITTTNFKAGILERDAGSTLDGSTRFGYSWIAIGPV